MKRFLVLILAITGPGCGSGGAARQAGRSITVVIHWPKRSGRLVPAAATSITLQVSVGGADGHTATAATVQAPAGGFGGMTTTTLGNLPDGALTLTATAFGSNGVADATGSTPVPVLGVAQSPVNDGQPISITMGTTIATIDVTPANPSVVVGATLRLQATAHDAVGNVVLTTPAKMHWTDTADSNATTSDDTSTGNGLIKGVQPGTAAITVTDLESGKTGTSNVTVTAVQYQLSMNATWTVTYLNSPTSDGWQGTRTLNFSNVPVGPIDFTQPQVVITANPDPSSFQGNLEYMFPGPIPQWPRPESASAITVTITLDTVAHTAQVEIEMNVSSTGNSAANYLEMDTVNGTMAGSQAPITINGTAVDPISDYNRVAQVWMDGNYGGSNTVLTLNGTVSQAPGSLRSSSRAISAPVWHPTTRHQ